MRNSVGRIEIAWKRADNTSYIIEGVCIYLVDYCHPQCWSNGLFKIFKKSYTEKKNGDRNASSR